MKIIDNRIAPRCPRLASLEIGTVFTINEGQREGTMPLGPYILIHQTTAIDCTMDRRCCVDLATGAFRRIVASYAVTVHTAELHLI